MPITPSLAQTEPPVGDALPTITIDGDSTTLEIRSGTVYAVVTKGLFRWGDLVLTADTISYKPDFSRIEAVGHIVLTRGDESIHGSRFVFDALTGDFSIDNADLLSPPYLLRTGKTVRNGSDATVDSLFFSPAPDGKSEFFLRAPSAHFNSDNGAFTLHRPSFYLFGKRLLTLQNYSFRFRDDQAPQEDSLQVPLTLRTSQIGGTVIGLDLPFGLGSGINGDARFDLPSQRGTQTRLLLKKEWQLRRLMSPHTPNDIFLYSPKTAKNESPIRRFLRARPLPTTADPITGFESYLEGSTLSHPTRLVKPTFSVSTILETNQEITGRRRGLLLLSRRPEAIFALTLPLGSETRTNNIAEERNMLRRARPVFSLGYTDGQYSEQEIQHSDRRNISRRNSVRLGLETQPLLVGSRLLIRPQFSFIQNRYSEQRSRFRILEGDFAADYVFANRTFVGASYIKRATEGKTPLSFDLTDAGTELQARGQMPFGKNGRYVVALQGRFDGATGSLFDYQVAVGIRGKALETRLVYKKLGGFVGFSITIPAFSDGS